MAAVCSRQRLKYLGDKYASCAAFTNDARGLLGLLLGRRRSHTLDEPLLRRAELSEVPSSLIQRNDVRPAFVVRVIELHRVVFPEADRADVVRPGGASVKVRYRSTGRANEWSALRECMRLPAPVFGKVPERWPT